MDNSEKDVKPASFGFKPLANSSEAREYYRFDVRLDDGWRAIYKTSENPTPNSCQIYDISSYGTCLIIPKSHGEPKKLQQYELTIMLSKKESFEVKGAVCWTEEGEEDYRVGVRFEYDHPQSKDPSLINISQTPLYGQMLSQLYYKELVSLMLVRFNRQLFVFIGKKKASLWVPGQTLKLTLSTTNRHTKIEGKIAYVTPLTDDDQEIGLTVQKLPSELERNLIDHTFQYTDTDLSMIRKAGFRPREIGKSFRFRSVKTHEEYLEVLKLRYKAYKAAGKVPEHFSFENMAAPLDPISRIIAVYHGDFLVGSVSMAFPESQEMILDTERAFEKGYPEKVPVKREMIEISRLCIDENYRKGDLLIHMFENIYKIFATSDRKYLISSTEDRLWPLYEGIGFHKTGMRYMHPFLKGIEHTVILIDKSVPTLSRKFSPLKWNFLYRDATEHMLQRGSIRFSPMQKFRFSILKLIGKLPIGKK